MGAIGGGSSGASVGSEQYRSRAAKGDVPKKALDLDGQAPGRPVLVERVGSQPKDCAISLLENEWDTADDSSYVASAPCDASRAVEPARPSCALVAGRGAGGRGRPHTEPRRASRSRSAGDGRAARRARLAACWTDALHTEFDHDAARSAGRRAPRPRRASCPITGRVCAAASSSFRVLAAGHPLILRSSATAIGANAATSSGRR